MFEFFDSIISHFESVWKVTNLIYTNVINAFSMTIQSFTLTGSVMTFLPTVLFLSMSVVIAIATFKLIISLVPF